MIEKSKEPQKKQLKVLERQRLADMEHKISADVNSFLVLLEEGSAADVENARRKARSDLLKWGQEMHHIAQTLGANYVESVSGYLNTIDTMLHCPTEYVDQEKINRCFHMTRDLKEML